MIIHGYFLILVFAWKAFLEVHAYLKLNWTWSENSQRIDPNCHYMNELNSPNLHMNTQE